MSDFLSSYWNWFIAVPTVISLLALFGFIAAFSTQKAGRSETRETTHHVWDDDLQEYNNPLPHWWLNLFYITLIFGVGYLILYPGLGTFPGLLRWTQLGQYDDEQHEAQSTFGPLYEKYSSQDLQAVAGDPKALSMGRRLFATYCISCHGSDGGGARGFPSLGDRDWLYGNTQEAIETSIADGRNGLMPAWKDVLSSEQINALVDYIVSLNSPGGETGTLPGKTLFTDYCAACHQADARGNPLLGAPNLTDDIWLYGNSREDLIETLTKGREGRMPAHGELLGKARIHILAAYVYSLAQNGTQPPKTK